MKRAKIVIDCVMVALLPLLMSYSLIGENVHEWLGIAMFVVFIIHHILNRKWLAGLFRGSYSPYRTYITIINILLCVIMLALPISGILMSKHAVPFLSISNGASLARTVHMTTAYWGFVLMSLHLGNHAKLMMNGTKKMFGLKERSAARTAVLRAAAALICLYGIYAFIRRRVAAYMFMQVMFAFFDHSENKIVFFADYIAIMIMFAIAGHYACEVLKKQNKAK